MVNEKYNLMMLGDIAAQKFKKCPILVIVADADQGKTDTKKIFMRECETAYEIEPISRAALPASLGERKISTYVLDDINGWVDDDLNEVLNEFKIIATEHLIKPQRQTKFSKEPARLSFAQCVIMVNGDQYDTLYPKIKKSGLYTRAIVVFTMQTDETTDYCFDFYEEYDCDSDNLPQFTDINIVERKSEDLTKQFKWIKANFKGYRASTIKMYSKLLSDTDFDSMKPIFSSTHRHPVIEEIKFEEKGGKEENE